MAQLAKELEARRLAAAGVMLLADERAKRAPLEVRKSLVVPHAAWVFFLLPVRTRVAALDAIFRPRRGTIRSRGACRMEAVVFAF